MIKTLSITGDNIQISDGYHTFDELYEHRIVLYITLCRVLQEENVVNIWRSKLHSDGSSFGGWFILGIRQVKGQQITYHLPESYWKECEFAQTLEKAPEFDGHNSQSVLKRLKEL
jgi:hypothetical protein